MWIVGANKLFNVDLWQYTQNEEFCWILHVWFKVRILTSLLLYFLVLVFPIENIMKLKRLAYFFE